MTDVPTARLIDARTIALRACLDLPDGEAKMRAQVALAALGDAIEQRSTDLELKRTLGHLEVLADALAAPGTQEAA